MKKLGQILAGIVAMAPVAAMAQTQAGPGAAYGGPLVIAIALGIGIAAFAGAFGQARTAAAALEGIARNPNAADKLFVPMILGLAFIESLVLFTWVLMLLMQLKM
jgi:F-type H+-transporting ATPase subunit c